MSETKVVWTDAEGKRRVVLDVDADFLTVSEEYKTARGWLGYDDNVCSIPREALRDLIQALQAEVTK